jgi:urease accessory protein
VGSAAGPLAGDELNLELQVRAGARATLVAAAATLAQGGTSALRTRVSVGPGASLRADPGPLVVAAGACMHVALSIALDPTASIEWRELLVLGRSGEAPGAATIDWDITCGGRPLLRQTVDVTDARLNRWPGMLHDKRVLATTFRAGPALDARTAVRSPLSVTQRVSGHAELSTEISDDTSLVIM